MPAREAQQVQGGTGGLSQGDSGSPGVLVNSQGGAGGTNQGGSGLTGTLENGQGGTDQASSGPSGGQGGASCLAGSKGGPGRTGSLSAAGRARSLGSSAMASWPAEGTGTGSWLTASSRMASRPCGTEEAFLLRPTTTRARRRNDSLWGQCCVLGRLWG